MTLPYPDSPDIDENIATSIERIKDNLDYLDGNVGAANIKCVISTGVKITSRTSGVLNLTGVGFQPKAMAVFASWQSLDMNSWGAATQYSTTTSIDCACVPQSETNGGRR